MNDKVALAAMMAMTIDKSLLSPRVMDGMQESDMKGMRGWASKRIRKRPTRGIQRNNAIKKRRRLNKIARASRKGKVAR
ncbi:MAG: hypothetical protein ABFD60_04310 [Bryobacteraceae bacterium]